MSLAAAMGMLFLILKIGPIRKVLVFDAVIDIAFTSLLMWSMSGTYTGIMVAIVAGGILSICLFIAKRMFPPDSLTPRGWRQSTERSFMDWLHDRDVDRHTSFRDHRE